MKIKRISSRYSGKHSTMNKSCLWLVTLFSIFNPVRSTALWPVLTIGNDHLVSLSDAVTTGYSKEVKIYQISKNDLIYPAASPKIIFIPVFDANTTEFHCMDEYKIGHIQILRLCNPHQRKQDCSLDTFNNSKHPKDAYIGTFSSADSLFTSSFYVFPTISVVINEHDSSPIYPKYKIRGYRLLAFSDYTMMLERSTSCRMMTFPEKMSVNNLSLLIDSIDAVSDKESTFLNPFNGSVCATSGCLASRIKRIKIRDQQISYLDSSMKTCVNYLISGEDFYVDGLLRVRTGVTQNHETYKAFYLKNGNLAHLQIARNGHIWNNIRSSDLTWLGGQSMLPSMMISQDKWNMENHKNSDSFRIYARIFNNTVPDNPENHIHTFNNYRVGTWRAVSLRGTINAQIEYYLESAEQAFVEIPNPFNPEDPTDFISLGVPAFYLRTK